ncbi:MAG: histidine kinase [Rhodothalassiaceae bacterium]|nr:MAG: histidine kinase [Rhodothalassiaceae bacterium]
MARHPPLLLSPLLWRVLAVNLVSLIILAGGVLYLSDFRRRLVDDRLMELAEQARALAGAIGESAVVADGDADRLDAGAAERLVIRLVDPKRARARIFDAEGRLVLDSRQLGGGRVEAEELPPLEEERPRLVVWLNALEDRLAGPRDDRDLPVYEERGGTRAGAFPEVLSALVGESDRRLRRLPEGGLMLSAAEPIQRFRRVLGAVLLTADSRALDRLLDAERRKILKVVALSFAVTLALSLYLALGILRPIRRLSQAAERIRFGASKAEAIPRNRRRRDEIGVLSRTLAEMTEALYHQLDRVERFAADVAHELKNPLSSLRSASEALAKARDAATRRRLMAIIAEDVRRIDRLIRDISEASRLDAELTRSRQEILDLGALLAELVSHYRDPLVHGERLAARGIGIVLEGAEARGLKLRGVAGRLMQVFANLIDNAVSFSPEGGTVRIRLARDGARIRVTVDDDGPGLPAGAEEKIFERFYSERPEGEAFGIHSGLGLAIARQIVEAHGGRITAANRTDDEGRVLGARFEVELPAADG